MRDLAAEVLIVGGGPAGSALGALLADLGRDVLLIDRHRFPRRKACGECVNPGGVAMLERLGLRDAAEETGAVPLRGWALATPARRRGPQRGWAGFRPPLVGWGIDRATFDLALLNEARRRGVRVLEGLRVQAVDPGGGARRAVAIAREGGGREAGAHLGGGLGSGADFVLRADMLVGADGLRSVVAREMARAIDSGIARHPGGRGRARLRKASLTWRVRGRGPDRSAGRLLLGGEATVGLAPVPGGRAGEGRWNATLVVDSERLGKDLRGRGWALLEAGLRELAEEWIGGWTEGPIPCGEPLASGPFDRPMRVVQTGRALLVGDAAGYYDPLTGQGIFRALRGAELAAGAVERALGPRGGALDESALVSYPTELRREFSTGVRVQRVIEAVLSRPILREAAISMVGGSPAAGALVAGLVGDARAAGRSAPARGAHAQDR